MLLLEIYIQFQPAVARLRPCLCNPEDLQSGIPSQRGHLMGKDSRAPVLLQQDYPHRRSGQ